VEKNKLNMEENNWEVKWVTGELVKRLEYWQKQNNASMELYKLAIGDRTISMDEMITITPIVVNGKKLRVIVSEVD